ncbi:Methyltransferase domain-containing protein [Pleurostoma richardsiae]|uniref:Methyltransferase domain-containing protein n=1 Tax=Pleurostoma richardsiae TaxID=41990 RepID=A0AA38VI92_9PEZI|nr:Methyltransferase domain-containing protein [Pleurostoma richardsiae]
MASGEPTTTSEIPAVLPPEHWTETAEALNNDEGSALGEEKSESTTSLTSTILKYTTIHGRTYHSERGGASYWFGSNDEGHNESLDIMHHVFTLCLGDTLYFAPSKNPRKALDFPDCEVVDTDVSPIQPSCVPPNLKFEIEDCTQEWTFSENEFNYIHTRYLVGCIVDWTTLFKEAFRCTRPGGYLESYEASPNVYSDDNTLLEKSASAQWGPLFINGGKAIGRSFTITDDGEKNIKCPTGGRAADSRMKEIGQYSLMAVMQDVEGFILFMTTVATTAALLYLRHGGKDTNELLLAARGDGSTVSEAASSLRHPQQQAQKNEGQRKPRAIWVGQPR